MDPLLTPLGLNPAVNARDRPFGGASLFLSVYHAPSIYDTVYLEEINVSVSSSFRERAGQIHVTSTFKDPRYQVPFAMHVMTAFTNLYMRQLVRTHTPRSFT